MYFTYLECDAGTFGPRCEKVCPYPYYGSLCILKCDCNEDLCNPSNGCSCKWRTTYVFSPNPSRNEYALMTLIVIFLQIFYSFNVIAKKNTSTASSQIIRMLGLSSTDAEGNNCKSYHLLFEKTFYKTWKAKIILLLIKYIRNTLPGTWFKIYNMS